MKKNQNQSPLASLTAEQMDAMRNGGPYKDGFDLTKQERRDFMAGYRQGNHLEGEPLPPLASNPSEEYTRGYAWGVEDYVPGIPYDDPESPRGIKGFFSRLLGN